jgi:[protein-PII] uridylyltransferase
VTTDTPADMKQRLATGRATLKERFIAKPNPDRLLREHSTLVDGVLRTLWDSFPPPPGAALVATGGYGRRELFPHSDIDLLILIDGPLRQREQDWLSALIGSFWDAGLDVGHGVRTVQECIDVAAQDVTVRTAMLDCRHLRGSRRTYGQLQERLRSSLDPVRFMEAKRFEQDQRHAKHQDTPFSLEPNLKESPGGLRDLQVILWIAHAAGVARDWRDFVRAGLLEEDELRSLRRQEKLIRSLRIRLHYLAGRREDRIIFDLQAGLADQLKVTSRGNRRSSELLMQRFYRAAKIVTQLNRILLQNLASRLSPEREIEARELNERFRARADLLEAIDEQMFVRDPKTILESFLLLQQHRDLRGMTASTLRSLWRAVPEAGPALRESAGARLLFLQILQQPRGIVHEFRRMNQYDVLGLYLPEFGRIVGQMQHDLFHVYTVDQHILMVLRNLRRFTMTEFAHEFPRCSQLMNAFPKRWLLYIAALYHDIAKGRGGDHSALGTRDVRRFCRRHSIPREDMQLVEFLVRNHLLMSSVAQKQDIHDPDVVRNFAGVVGSVQKLVALYLLTVADVRGTSPKVWNAWKGKLLEDLFQGARRILSGESLPIEGMIAEKQAEALRLLRLYALPDESKDGFWRMLDTTYFLRHDPQEVAWQTRNLHYRLESTSPVVRARLSPIGEGLQIMVYCKDRDALFARICGYFEKSGFSIVEAKVHTTRNGYALDSFLVLGTGTGVHYRDLMALIEKELAERIGDRGLLPLPLGGRLSRRVRHFPISPSIELRPDERGSHYSLSIIASDRPGLLYGIARILSTYGVNLHSAKINTLGDRAEDVFLLSGEILNQPSKVVQLEQDMLAELQVKGAVGESRSLSPNAPVPARGTARR